MYPAMILLLNLRNALLVAVLAGLIWRLPALLQPEADNFNGGTTSAAATANREDPLVSDWYGRVSAGSNSKSSRLPRGWWRRHAVTVISRRRAAMPTARPVSA